MARFIWLVLVCAGVYWLARRAALNAAARARGPGARAASTAAMGQCAYCGVHFPIDEVVCGADGRHFCSASHEQSAVHANPT